jgi:hypothetical protein
MLRVGSYAFREALGEGARAVVEVPVEGLRELQALRDFEAERVDVGDEQQQRGELLSAARDAEFMRLLDGNDGNRRLSRGLQERRGFKLMVIVT